ncbi:hypothetical protein DSO57_1016184 [Entomophthora muscae]|uniref:Uncharacterized protein n=1 Tax=Entomophthora muscae TaxID=34485 RepID=A0ACC2TFY5_9FUNG|nr:hypothetical protein DSO57_1016184 [Entomophthora muscae]
MNAFVNIPDNNLSTFEGLESIPPWVVSGTPKKKGLVSNTCSLLPSSFNPEMAVNSVFSVPKFEPGSPFDLVDKDLFKFNVNLSSIQSLPCKLAPSQSMIVNVDSKQLDVTPGDVGNGFEDGDHLLLLSGPLAAVPSVVPPLSPPGPPVSMKELQPAKAMPRIKDQAKNTIPFIEKLGKS